jgi:putative DNA primase/helicase
MNVQDGLADTIRPRLEAAGADLERVHYFRGVQRKGSELFDPPEIPHDIDALKSLIQETQVCQPAQST